MSGELSADFTTDQPMISIDAAKALVKHLESGNNEEANRIINKLSGNRDNDLFQEIGKLTRVLHEKIHSPIDDNRMQVIMRDDIPDARERLDYVIKLTEQSAHNTLASVENGMPVVDGLSDRAHELKKQWQDFMASPKDVGVFRSLAIDNSDYLQRVMDESKIVHSHLSDILMAQGYQDLTGQVIQHVMNIVQEVEQNLVDIIQTSSQVTGVAQESGTKKNNNGYGPAIPGANDGTVLNSQDDVDDLLSTLGF